MKLVLKAGLITVLIFFVFWMLYSPQPLQPEAGKDNAMQQRKRTVMTLDHESGFWEVRTSDLDFAQLLRAQGYYLKPGKLNTFISLIPRARVQFLKAKQGREKK